MIVDVEETIRDILIPKTVVANSVVVSQNIKDRCVADKGVRRFHYEIFTQGGEGEQDEAVPVRLQSPQSLLRGQAGRHVQDTRRVALRCFR